MSLHRLERVIGEMAKIKPDLVWIALTGAPTSSINNRERRRAWNMAQIVMEAVKLKINVILEGSARNIMWETSGL
eukprot:9223539-Pyramimonas_sp.AAC.1